MYDYLFPVEYSSDHGDVTMIDQWMAGKKPYLSFAFHRHFPNALPKEPFWMFFYYTKSSTEEPQFRGRLRFRFHVIDWASEPYLNESTFSQTFTTNSRIWFLMDRFQEVGRVPSGLLAYEDFRHPEGKNLGSCLRSSISPAICTSEISILKQYPDLI